MEIRLVEDKDFMQLAELYCEMYKAMDPAITEFQAVNTLMAFINGSKDYLAIGLYDGTVLVGFVAGNQLLGDIFYFSGIHLVIKNTEWTRKMIDFSFAFIKEKGYKFWEVDATNKNIASIMEHYGAKVKYTRYVKEMD